MMRSQQALAVGGAQGYLPPDHYDQIFSAHGTIRSGSFTVTVRQSLRDRVQKTEQRVAMPRPCRPENQARG
jgi:hypothetical protein